MAAYSDSTMTVSTISTKSSKSARLRFSRSPQSTPRSSFGADDGAAEPPDISAKKYRFSSAPKLVKTPWEADRSKRAFSRQWRQEREPQDEPGTLQRSLEGGRKPSLSAGVFKRLPREVYDCILRQLEALHFEQREGACLSCYLADVMSLCLTSKAWEPRARRSLYQNLWVMIDDVPSNAKHKTPPLLRLKLLRRTLRENPALAATVRSVNVPHLQTHHQRAASDHDRAAAVGQLAALVMACPNLESASGLLLPFDHAHDRLAHALSTRARLAAHAWRPRAIEARWTSDGRYATNARAVLSDGSVANDDAFLSSHARWRNLQTLLLFGQGSGNLDYRALVGTFRSLPALRRLLVARLDARQFNDRTAAALPRGLHALRLQDLPGLTQRGVERLVSDAEAVSELRALSLINVDVAEVRHLRTLFALAPRLARFALVQASSPVLDDDHDHDYTLTVDDDDDDDDRGQDDGHDVVYASASLRFLHWDVSPGGAPSLRHLASSMRAGALPALRALRCPCDDGALQALCRPRRSAAPRASSAISISSSSSSSASSSSDAAAAGNKALPLPPPARNPGGLAAARRAAQGRLERARGEPLVRVVVTDERGEVVERMGFGGFVGRLGSRVEYVLDADGGGDGRDGGGLLEVEDLLGAVGSAGACSGAAGDGWVGKSGFQVKHGKGHRPRERVRHVSPESFF